MSRLDFVIFGATGFTGKKAIEEADRLAKKDNSLTWGVGGRSKAKLGDVLANASKKIGGDLSKVKIIIADIDDEASLKAMTEQAKVIVNCCGPYRFFGEPVVKACIATKTHYVDVSGEPQFIETMQLVYGKQAEEAGVYVISACGFDSVPNDLGTMFLKNKFNGTLNWVESYLHFKTPKEYMKPGVAQIHYGTWASLVHGVANWNELPALRKKIYPEKLPTFKPKLQPRGVVHKKDGKWCLPFPGADGSVVYRTQRYLYEQAGEGASQRPVQFKPYAAFPSLMAAILTLIGAGVVFLLGQLKFTRKLLLDYPRFFSFGMVSHAGPPEECMANTTFHVLLEGQGWDETVKETDGQPMNKKMVAKVSGVNPGYGMTTTALLICALTILQETDKLPGNGGVLTTGAAFNKTNIIERLNENNVTFEIVKDID